MMIFRFLLPLVFCGTACTAFVSVAGQPASRDLQGDALFDWDSQSIEGYPTATFTSESINNEIEFGYEFAGELTDEKYLTVDLRQTDCITPADDLALVAFDYVGGQYLWVDVDVIQETIESSVHYNQTNETFAQIDFCLRIDYNMAINGVSESINFHETVTTVQLNLTAGFDVTDIIVTRDGAVNSAEDIQYPVMAYFCGDDNSNVSQQVLKVGENLQFCVKSLEEDLFVSDILYVGIYQTGSVEATPIASTFPDPQTAKDCSTGGICNIKTLLPSRFFEFEDPIPLLVQGLAILEFGSPSRLVHRRLAVPVHIHAPGARQLKIKESDFLLEAEVQSSFKNNNNEEMYLWVPIGLVIGLLGGGLAVAVCCTRKKRREQNEQKEQPPTIPVVVTDPEEGDPTKETSKEPVDVNEGSYVEK
jgi:hypothetical protein